MTFACCREGEEILELLHDKNYFPVCEHEVKPKKEVRATPKESEAEATLNQIDCCENTISVITLTNF